jgi:hypothetical protein
MEYLYMPATVLSSHLSPHESPKLKLDTVESDDGPANAPQNSWDGCIFYPCLVDNETETVFKLKVKKHTKKHTAGAWKV